MRIRTTMTSLCMAMMLLPLSAAAKQPVAAGCEILVAASVHADTPFTVTVTRAPGYPGQWVAPVVTVEIIAPVNADLLGPNRYSQIVSQDIDGLGGANAATATFIIPAFPNLDVTGAVNIFATVSEPLNRGRSLETACQAATSLM